MTFKSCIERLESSGLLLEAHAPHSVNIDRLTSDSRTVGSSECFVALRGRSVDGHLFIDKAVLNGATSIVCEAGPESGIQEMADGPAWARVKDSRRALAQLASLAHEDPGKKLTLIAITGTNGKTTIASVLRDVLESAGLRCGFIGTIGIHDGVQTLPATHTTPDPLVLHAVLSAMVENGCTHCVMEASSHAIDQHRFRLSDIDVAVFTNLTRDHLDYHGTEEAYLQAKKGLFDALSTTAHAVVNTDDAKAFTMIADTAAEVTTFGAIGQPDVHVTIEANDESGLHLTLDGDTRRYLLAGTYNASNLAASFAAGRALGLERAFLLETLAAHPPVPGRFERLTFQNGRTVIVDYAHTPDALENVLLASREAQKEGSWLWCIFGCGGDRDTGKRPLMGAVAERRADRVIITSDNPRSEDPDAIMDDVRSGFRQPGRAIGITDRREAIRYAARLMRRNDVLVLAGKGHETTQVIGEEVLHFDDREEARSAFGPEAASSSLSQDRSATHGAVH